MGCGFSKEDKQLLTEYLTEIELLIACGEGQVDAARLSLDKGAHVNQVDKDGMTPLHTACAGGHLDLVRLLLEKGAEVDRATKKGSTPLFIAKKIGHSSIVALLEEHQK